MFLDGMWNHHRPAMLMKVFAIVRAAKFLIRTGWSASVSHADGACVCCLLEHFCFLDQGEAGLDQTLGQNQPVSFRPRFHHQRNIPLDLDEPSEVSAGCEQLRGAVAWRPPLRSTF